MEKYSCKQNLKYMFGNLWNFDKKSMILAFFIIPARILLPIVTGLVIKIMIDSITAGISETNMILLIAGITFIIGMLTWVEPVLKERLNAVSENLNVKYRIKSFNKMMSLNYERLESTDGRKKFEKSKNFISGRQYGNTWFGFSIINFFSNSLGVFSYIFVFSLIKPIMLLILLIATTALIIATQLTIKVETKVDEKFNELDLKNDYVFRTATNVAAGKDIRAYSFESHFKKIILQLESKYKGIQSYSNRGEWLFGVVLVILSLITEASAFFFLLKDVIAGLVTVADFIFIFGIATGMWGWIIGIVWTVQSLKRIAIHCGYYREFIEIDDENGMSKPLSTIPNIDDIEEIEFQNVDFTYPQAEKPTINNVNFKIKRGEKIAIVGENGAGKTTCIKLLCGLYNSSKGKITINGADISKISRDEYFRLFSVVFQDHILLPLSIKQNIILNAEVDGERLKKVLCESGMADIINKLEQGADTLLIKKINDKAVDLSGGETQKLLLARALYKEAPILILDEPTAALDPIAENNLYNKYNELTKDKISFFISHRLSSTRFCDRIFFIDDGQIIECGSHEELMAAKGAYAKMFDIQSFYYRESNNFNTEEQNNGG